jgi:dolichol-phosphate mannosyltransferase
VITVLLPAYNEEHSLPELLPKIDAALGSETGGYKIIACDDGSSDKTAELLVVYAETLPLEIITHPINRGLGETARDLFERAAEQSSPEDIVVRMDCDDTHEPEIIKQLVEKIAEGYDVVIASRFQPGGGQVGVSPFRAFLSRSANIFMKVFFPIRGVFEYSCGFRAYRAGIVQQAIAAYGNNFIQLKGLGFTSTLEKLVKLKLLGARFAEVPFVLRYDQKRTGSKMIMSVTMLGYMIMTVMYYWPGSGWRVPAKRLRKVTH